MSLSLRTTLLSLLLVLFSFGVSIEFAHADPTTPAAGAASPATPGAGAASPATPGAGAASPATPGAGAANTDASPGTGETLQNPLQNIDDLPGLLHALLQAVVELGGIALTIMLVWVGFLFVTAQGNPEKISTARSALIWTVVGGLILLGAEAISLAIQNTVQSL